MNRGALWCDEEVRALIHVWGEDKIQQELDGASRNKPIFVAIAKKMNEKGYNRDWQQCKAKIKNLKGEYRAVKDHNNGTGRGRKTCKFFSELDEILGCRPASVPSVLLESCSTPDLQSVGDVEDGDGNANGKIYTEILHNLIWTSYMMYIVTFVTDETDLHVDSGTTSETAEPTSDPELDEEGQ